MTIQKWNVDLNVHLLSEGNVVPEQMPVTANTLRAAVAVAEHSATWKHRTYYRGADGSPIPVLPNCEIQILQVRPSL
ncbi:MAG: hypothetical protein ABJO09_01145 [Hyphomicrobiales bacterium]